MRLENGVWARPGLDDVETMHLPGEPDPTIGEYIPGRRIGFAETTAVFGILRTIDQQLGGATPPTELYPPDGDEELTPPTAIKPRRTSDNETSSVQLAA